MEWDADCCIGFSAVDARREELFDTVRRLQTRNSMLDQEKVLLALKAAAQYASQVFPIEEELMREVFFPGLISHQEEHQNFKKEAIHFLEGLKNSDEDDLKRIVVFLNHFVERHLLGSDIEFARFKFEMALRQEALKIEMREKEFRQKPIEKIQKLKHLFKEKLINADDFRERKVKIFAEHLVSRGLPSIKKGIEDLDYFQKNDHLSEKEKKLAIIEFLGKVDLEKSLADLQEVEEKLILLNSFFEFELVSEEAFLNLKDKVLSQI